MSRARNLKPGFSKNEDLAELGAQAQLLFAGLWTLADRCGRLEDRPKRIKAEIFPYSDADVEFMLCALAGKHFIIRYEVAGERYIAVTTFDRHQNPHHRENESVIPPPGTKPQASPGPVPENPVQAPEIPGLAVLIPSSLIPSSLIPDSPFSDSGGADPRHDDSGLHVCANGGHTLPFDDVDPTLNKRTLGQSPVVTVTVPAWTFDEDFRPFVDLYQRSGKPVIDDDFTEAYRVWGLLSFEQRVDRVRIFRSNLDRGCYPDPQYIPSPKRFLVSEYKRSLRPPRAPPSSRNETAVQRGIERAMREMKLEGKTQ